VKSKPPVKWNGMGSPQLSPHPDVCAPLKLDLIQSQMTQKPKLRGEVDARALCVRSQSVSGWSGKHGKCNAFGSWVHAWFSVAFRGRVGVVSFLFVVQAPPAVVEFKAQLILSR
jgi:hypothetical protein